MGIEQDKLKPAPTPLIGFTGDKLMPLGTISFPVTTGSGEHKLTRVIDFLVVDCPSAYNVILGRLVLN